MEQLLRGQAVSALERNMPGQAAQPESTAGWGQAAQPEEAACPGDGLYPEEAPCQGDGLHSEEAIYPGTAWDLSGPVLYFPVRHHSPVCSFHLLRAVEAYGPDCILVEGPQNARHLIPVLIHPETKPPCSSPPQACQSGAPWRRLPPAARERWRPKSPPHPRPAPWQSDSPWPAHGPHLK